MADWQSYVCNSLHARADYRRILLILTNANIEQPCSVDLLQILQFITRIMHNIGQVGITSQNFLYSDGSSSSSYVPMKSCDVRINVQMIIVWRKPNTYVNRIHHSKPLGPRLHVSYSSDVGYLCKFKGFDFVKL